MASSQTEAYNKVRTAGLNEREAEADCLTRAAAMMRRLQLHWNDPSREKKLENALWYNLKLWNLFHVAVQDHSSPLTPTTKGRILRLSAYVDRKTSDVLAFPSQEKLDVLIQINLNIAAGLRSPATKTHGGSRWQ